MQGCRSGGQSLRIWRAASRPSITLFSSVINMAAQVTPEISPDESKRGSTVRSLHRQCQC